jgi:hypothetical protein
MNNEGCECVICLDNIINKNNNCNICNNGVCNHCYVNLINRNYDDTSDIIYKCPFCKKENLKTWTSLDNNVIVSYFTKHEYEQRKEIWKFRDIIYDKDDEINRLKNIIINKNKEIKKHKDLIESQSNIINNLTLNLPTPPLTVKKLRYQEFYKITYRNLKNSDIEMSAQERMKRVSVLWHEYKKSFEVAQPQTSVINVN